MSKFSIGEIAIINCPPSKFHNLECEIISPLVFKTLRNTWDGSTEECFCHIVHVCGYGDKLGGFPIAFKSDELRKRRPPQDNLFTEWFKSHIITDPICVPSQDEVAKFDMTNVFRSIKSRPADLKPVERIDTTSREEGK